MKKKKKLKMYSPEIEFEAIYERAMITAQLMKSRQDNILPPF